MRADGKKHEQGIGYVPPLEQSREPDIGALEAAAAQVSVFPGWIQGRVPKRNRRSTPMHADTAGTPAKSGFEQPLG
jgi:hypothetical protein